MDNEVLAMIIMSGTKIISEFIRYRPLRIDEPPQRESSLRIEASAHPKSEVVKKGVSTADTIAYQKDQLVKQITLMEMHLAQGCKIGGAACDCCLPEGTLIYTNPGLSLINDRNTSHVITHHGRKRRVLQHFSRDFKGDLREIKLGYTNIPLRLTPDHLIYGVKNVRKRQRDIWRKQGITESDLQWMLPSSLTDKDFIAFPRIKDVVDQDISPEMSELYGWYIAEGSKTAHRLTFSLNKTGDELKQVASLIERLLGPVKIYTKPSVMHVCFTDKDKTAVFDDFGHGARRKRIPQCLMLLPEEKTFALLRGIFRGDGHTDKYQFVLTTTSEELAFQLRLLLFRVGILHSLYARNGKSHTLNGRVIKPNGPRYDIHISGDAARLFSAKTGMHFSGGKRTSGNFGWMSENYAFLPVNLNNTVYYEGRVHNIGVEEDESYLTLHGAVHNCEKHPMVIEALAEETLGMTGEDIYKEIMAWCNFLKERTTAEASASGQYDKEYPVYALEGRRLRKELMGSTIGPPLPQAVMKEVKDLSHQVASGAISREQAIERVKKITESYENTCLIEAPAKEVQRAG